MEFKINPAVYPDIFAVPRTVVENNIRLASADALRVILLIFAHPEQPVSAQTLAETLHKPVGEISDALLFWMERGVLTDAAASEAAAPLKQAAVPAAAPPAEVKKQVADLPLARPTHEQIAIRCSENEAFRELFREAQQKLGKTIGYEGQSLLIMLHDTYDLPVEVILMLLEYAKSKGKTGYKYLAALGRDWSEKEIDSLESAEAYLEELTGTDALWEAFRRHAGLKNLNPTAKQRRFLTAWRKELGFDFEMIFLAYEICIDNTGKLSVEYMDKVLRSWQQTGVKTPDDAERARLSWQEKKKSAKKTPAKKESVYSSDASYDLDAYSKTAIGLQSDPAPDAHS